MCYKETLAPFLFVICLDYVLRKYIDLMKENGLIESLQHSLEQATGGIGLHVNADKTEYMCFNQRDISTLRGGHLKLVDWFTYQGSRVSSPETDINTRLAKAWTAINWLSVIWKSDLTDKIKRTFFPSCGRIYTAVWMNYMDLN